MTDVYAKIYRRVNPNPTPHCPYSRQPELHHLWPCDQQLFRDTVDRTIEVLTETASELERLEPES